MDHRNYQKFSKVKTDKMQAVPLECLHSNNSHRLATIETAVRFDILANRQLSSLQLTIISVLSM